MSTALYVAISCLIGIASWLVLHAAWSKELNPFIVLVIAISITLLWPLALLGLLVICILVFINKPRQS